MRPKFPDGNTPRVTCPVPPSLHRSPPPLRPRRSWPVLTLLALRLAHRRESFCATARSAVARAAAGSRPAPSLSFIARFPGGRSPGPPLPLMTEGPSRVPPRPACTLGGGQKVTLCSLPSSRFLAGSWGLMRIGVPSGSMSNTPGGAAGEAESGRESLGLRGPCPHSAL